MDDGLLRISLPDIGPVLDLENLLMNTIDTLSAVFNDIIMTYRPARQKTLTH